MPLRRPMKDKRSLGLYESLIPAERLAAATALAID